jgi:hypothetical protein
MSHYISIDTQNTNEALLLCHNFNVESQDIKTERDIWIPDKKAIVRRDTNQYLGTVGKGWEPVQPIVLYNMAEELIQATDGRINGLINMLDGAVIGISFKLAEREFVEDDKIDLNFLMLTAFNGRGFQELLMELGVRWLNTSITIELSEFIMIEIQKK